MSTVARGPAAERRRPALAAFLRSRRARITPADVGLPPGVRRRTPGLRREEVAQLAGVGVTWYTWLEQGRRINASAQVLDAVARTLRLDAAEREHLFHLAEVPFAGGHGDDTDAAAVGADVQTVLDALVPLPAVVYNARYDVLGQNVAYAAVFLGGPGGPGAPVRPGGGPNALWSLFAGRLEDCPLVFRDSELKIMVATLRAAYGNHVGEPAWERFLRQLCEKSAEFAGLWASGDVVPPGPRLKTFRHPLVGHIRLRSESMSINGIPEARMVVYVPADEESRRHIGTLSDRARRS
ncbi:helix-turn-helix transcriptional regulator [Streptomyces johnsoniae]|uniref:Helix-turn-helix transcriptional regulator n=1 Tax=Streptomyces johnsoniae TaxID=3075532 RepID=A0ABU2SGU1_9ACTN|nr:helix-turn-helix transcriptional regulator [Streptomyces sp. DSM 41886]MDT0447104.1 helix-turn-helix transcriptional regulator [Streptomyces sp. DSM 41886]